jgi:hypothetical protein
MGNDERSGNMNIPPEEPRGRKRVDEYGRGADPTVREPRQKLKGYFMNWRL